MKWIQSCLYVEILVDLILITCAITLLSTIQNDFYDAIGREGKVNVVNNKPFWGPVQIVSFCNETNQNCEISDITPIQNYFSLKYLELLRGDRDITTNDIIDGRSKLFITLSIYIVLWFCLTCSLKLQDSDPPEHCVFHVIVCYFENSLSTLKMMLINIFAVSEIAPNILLLDFIPAFSIIVFVVLTCFIASSIGAIQYLYKKNEPLKKTCVILVMIILLAYFVLVIIPSIGLNIYLLRFCTKFTSKSIGILSAEFVKTVNLLKIFALCTGVIGWIKTSKPVIDMWILRRSKMITATVPVRTHSDAFTISP